MNNIKPIELELSTSKDNSKLYFFFGGIASGIAMPPFEFYRASKILSHSKVFFRDINQTWYQQGLPGLGNDLYATKSYIELLIDKQRPEKIFFIGNSMGGYAAILFSVLIGKGNAIAFAPQTFIPPLFTLYS